VPLAEDVTVEADSGGHTDNRPLAVVLPVIRALRDELTRRASATRPIRVGAAGGLGDPAGVAAAFAAGAAYVVTGTINQLSARPGCRTRRRACSRQADLADVAMAPAADMFEYGIKVQVLRRGTLFAARASQLYETYLACGRSPTFPTRPASGSRRTSCAAPSKTAGSRPAGSGWTATRARSTGPSRIRATGWPWSSAPTWDCRAGGRSPASRPG
jgi:NAD(P)H-dependent flavin oxidoreductase YrpB (nitropropane dioxygenase family)